MYISILMVCIYNIVHERSVETIGHFNLAQ